MITVDPKTIEAEIIRSLQEVNTHMGLGLEGTINEGCCPGAVGVRSQILLNIMVDLQESLGIKIPDNIYIFHDPKTHKQLSVSEATQKLLKVATYAS